MKYGNWNFIYVALGFLFWSYASFAFSFEFKQADSEQFQFYGGDIVWNFPTPMPLPEETSAPKEEVAVTESPLPQESPTGNETSCGETNNKEEIKRLKADLKLTILEALQKVMERLAGLDAEMKAKAEEALALAKEADLLKADGKEEEAEALYLRASGIFVEVERHFGIRFNLAASTARRRVASRFYETYEKLSAAEQFLIQFWLKGSGEYYIRLLFRLIPADVFTELHKKSLEIKRLEEMETNCSDEPASDSDAWDELVACILEEGEAAFRESEESREEF